MFFPKTSARRHPGVARLSFAGIVVALLLLLAACGGSQNSSSGGTASSTPSSSSKAAVPAPNDLITPGYLTVGSDTTYPPQESIDPTTNQPVGFDIDLIKAVAQKMGLTARIQSAGFDSIIPSLDSKRFDVVISAMTITPDREQKVDFVPYFSAGESLLVQKGNPMHIKTVADLCGQPVAVENGTIEQTDLQTASANCKKAGKSAINVTVLPTQTAVIQLLATNRVVATYQDSPVTDYYLKLHAGQFDIGGSVINAAPEGIAIRKGDTSMLNAVKTAFNDVKADGTYHALIEKWGLTSGELTGSTSDVMDQRFSIA
jgi:polar amino acid transport system substrate-binding protein